MATKLELNADKVGLCIVDVQEKMAAAMPEKVIKGTLRNCLNMIETARVFRLPVMVTEHCSAIMGRSLPVVAESVLRLPTEQVHFLEKGAFDCARSRRFQSWVKQTGRQQWVLSGLETHVSVFQTGRSMVAAGYNVHVPRDAVVSRTMANWETGLQLLDRAGAVVTCTETVVFDLVKEAESDEFGLLSMLIK